MKSRWKKYLLYTSIIIVGGWLLFILTETVKAKNTGFETKTLWDWMQLLIIPLVLSLGAYYLNFSERKAEREIASDRQREEALQLYLDRMVDLILKEGLQHTNDEKARNVARIRTLTVLRRLDGKRKGYVLQFLQEAGLINTDLPRVKLTGADLSGADLRMAALGSADLGATNMRGANLIGAWLRDAQLGEANLENANLSYSVMLLASLRGANLKGADLSNTHLEHTNLQGAKVTNEQLATAKSLKEAIMPDGTKHE